MMIKAVREHYGIPEVSVRLVQDILHSAGKHWAPTPYVMAIIEWHALQCGCTILVA